MPGLDTQQHENETSAPFYVHDESENKFLSSSKKNIFPALFFSKSSLLPKEISVNFLRIPSLNIINVLNVTT